MPHIPATFSCPHCQAPLRLRQRPAGTLQLPCPDCGRPLELNDQAGELLVRPAELPSASATRPTSRVAATALPSVPRRTWTSLAAKATQVGANPLVVTWLAAGVAAGLLAAAFLRTNGASPAAAKGSSKREVAASDVAPPQKKRDREARPAEIAEPVAQAVGSEVSPESDLAGRVSEPLAPVVAAKPPASPPVDPRVEVAARLAQRVLRFEQPTPVPFETLRIQIEEMTGVAIRYEAAGAEGSRFREAEVRLALADVTLAAVLDEAARQAGLEAVVDAQGVTLVPAGGEVRAVPAELTASP